MPGEKGGPPSTAVSLNDLFGTAPPADDPTDAGTGTGTGTGDDPRDAGEPGGGDRTSVGEARAAPPAEEPALRILDLDGLGGEPALGAGEASGTAEPAGPRALSIGELTEDRETPDDEVRTVSFDGPSGDRRSRPAGSRAGARRSRGTAGRSRRGEPSAPPGHAEQPDRSDPRDRTDRRDRADPRDRAGRSGPGDAGTGGSGGGRGRGGRRRGAAAPVDETPAEQETRAKDICLRLLTDRPRTVKELGDALTRKEIPEEVARRVLERFDEVGLVDDKAFAEQWVRSRHRHRGLGKRAIALELHRKGVDRDLADEALTEIDEDSERERARELVVRRLRGLSVGSREERQSAARKLVGMLARKGYGPGVAYGVVKEEIAAAGADADELGEPPED